jgi:hypothetical protein
MQADTLEDDDLYEPSKTITHTSNHITILLLSVMFLCLQIGVILPLVKKGKSIPVTGRGGP